MKNDNNDKNSERAREAPSSEPAADSTSNVKAQAVQGIQTLRRGASSLPSAVLIYCGMAVSLLGILPVLAVLGIIGDGPVELLGILFGFLFGVIFGGGGGLALYIGLANAMHARLGRSHPFFTSLLQLVWLRANRNTLYAAAPVYLLALQILWVIVSPDSVPWLQRGDLQYLVVLEFFAIHSTAFLGIIAFARWTGWGGLATVPQAAIFLAFLSFYVFAAHQAAGLVGAIVFTVLTLSKYVSYAVRPLSSESKGKLILRWFTGLIIFMVVSNFFDVDLEARDNLGFAVTYFFILALFETFDLMAPSAEDSARAAATRSQDRTPTS